MTINASTMIENSKQLLLFCGLPKQGDNIAAFRKDGGSRRGLRARKRSL